MNIQDLNLLQEKGIYMIKNLVNNKVYIGSTERSFLSRWKKHFRMLKRGYHYNNHLQLSWNKYSEDNFEFSIIEVTNIDILIKEKDYIEKYKSSDKNQGYNNIIDPTLSPSLQLSTKEKISKTLKQGYKDGRISISSSTFKKGIIPWNTGKRFSNPASKKAKRKKLKTVDVYDINMNYLGNWGSAPDLSDFTMKSNILKEELYPLGINRSCISGKPYKNLYFKYAPLNSNV